MIFSPGNLIIAIACLVGAIVMLTKLRRETPVSIPVGILLALASVYITLREFVSGIAGNQTVGWIVKGILVVFLIYMLLSYNNVRAEQRAEFEENDDETAAGQESDKNSDQE